MDLNIKFILDIEIEGILQFLDIELLRVNQNLSFNVSIKPMKSNKIISFNSDHPLNNGIYDFSLFIKRSFRVCSKFLQRELNFIKRIPAEHGFPSNVTDKTIERHINPLSRFQMVISPKFLEEIWLCFKHLRKIEKFSDRLIFNL